jgi:hypothetical protein
MKVKAPPPVYHDQLTVKGKNSRHSLVRFYLAVSYLSD